MEEKHMSNFIANLSQLMLERSLYKSYVLYMIVADKRY